MADSTMSVSGTTNQLLLITDQDGTIYRIPKTALSRVVDSSNVNSYRIDIHSSSGAITLLFDSATTLNTFLALLDTYY